MSIDSIVELEKHKELWYERNNVRIDIESELRELFRNKLYDHLEKAKDDFRKYFEKKLDIVNEKNTITAFRNDYKIIIKFDEPNPGEKYEFVLAIINNGRKECNVVIHSIEKTYYPPLKIIRKLHETIELINNDLDMMDKEMIWMEETKNNLEKLPFVYSYFNSDNKKPEYKKLKRFDNMISLLDKLLG